ncbi:uncharacterized protein LOC111601582 [Drosophila hydei]|uniref:Uncharacterized protein LOC111601582 n=1 Tax=Drosophila hydei TaxID=7224 RepID=A0A6J1M6L2_DROHY|nr:uncharacterized protein LOC111601582 [Drosophila hydei]
MIGNGPRGSFLDERISRPYGKEVLLANWQELRQGSNELNDCILPGLKRVDACLRHTSETQDNFEPINRLQDPDYSKQLFLGTRNEALHNFKRNRSSQLNFSFDEDMQKNLTTTYSIVYEILPKLARDEKKSMESASTVPSRRHHIDLMISYGNRTKTGKLSRRRADLHLEKLRRLQTTYMAEYERNGLHPAFETGICE